jgi:SAM-dependent methyltransferase
MPEPSSSPTRPDYGIDAPGVVRTFALLGVAAVALGISCYIALQSVQPGLAALLLHLGIWPGVSWLGTASVMLWGSKVGKLRLREQMLDAIPWRGEETVLDIGCGRGLLLIGAAKRLTTGKAVGVDLWQRADLSGNRPEATWHNAQAEGVAERIEIKSGDARQLPFADEMFDVVVSSSALHNIYNPVERQKALREIVRVLKPNGHVALFDIRHTQEYAQVLRDSGLTEVHRSGPRLLFVIPAHTVTARKAPKA